MDRPRCTTDRIHDVCAMFAWNWQLPEAEIEAGVLDRLADVRWPTFDQIALAASRECKTRALRKASL